MKYLLDTHVFLWSLLDTKKIKPKTLEIIENECNTIFLSPISFWEIAIKYQLKKLDLQGINLHHLPNIAKEFNYTILAPQTYDFLSIGQLPQKENHHDPFDRMLIQQAIRNNLVLISKDERFPQYEENGLQLLWE